MSRIAQSAEAFAAWERAHAARVELQLSLNAVACMLADELCSDPGYDGVWELGRYSELRDRLAAAERNVEQAWAAYEAARDAVLS